jgi:uncharacterized membrane protein
LNNHLQAPRILCNTVSINSQEVRAMTKTISFAVVHFVVAFSVGYVLSGSVLVGGAIALVEPAVNTVAYHLHEKVWSRFQTAGATSPRLVQSS